MTRGRRSASIAVLCATTGCATVLGIDGDYTQGEGGSPGTTSSGAGATTGTGAAATGTGASSASAGGTAGTGGISFGGQGGIGAVGGETSCPDGPGPKMIDVGQFCIDATEVTNAHYLEFLAANVSPQAVTMDPSYCSWNMTFVPVTGPPVTLPPNQPVSTIDWCDAQGYCAWAGKHLCGKIGGGSNLLADLADASKSEWQFACSNGGVTAFPYGNLYSAAACNDGPFGAGGFVDVGVATNCHGLITPFDVVLDLSGNAHEWDNSCDGETGPDDNCAIRGGSFSHPETELTCAILEAHPRNSEFGDNGFRCCFD